MAFVGIASWGFSRECLCSGAFDFYTIPRVLYNMRQRVWGLGVAFRLRCLFIAHQALVRFGSCASASNCYRLASALRRQLNGLFQRCFGELLGCRWVGRSRLCIHR